MNKYLDVSHQDLGLPVPFLDRTCERINTDRNKGGEERMFTMRSVGAPVELKNSGKRV